MNDAKYIGFDVHEATISGAVRDSTGKLAMEAILETKTETILQFVQGLRGSLHVIFEEGTWAAWLHDLLQPHVTRVVASDPRKNALLKDGNKNDRMDARKLSELLYLNKFTAVYHGQHGYSPRYRAEWLAKIAEVGVRRRAELYYLQFDTLAALRQGVRRELITESRKH